MYGGCRAGRQGGCGPLPPLLSPHQNQLPSPRRLRPSGHYIMIYDSQSSLFKGCVTAHQPPPPTSPNNNNVHPPHPSPNASDLPPANNHLYWTGRYSSRTPWPCDRSSGSQPSCPLSAPDCKPTVTGSAHPPTQLVPAAKPHPCVALLPTAVQQTAVPNLIHLTQLPMFSHPCLQTVHQQNTPLSPLASTPVHPPPNTYPPALGERIKNAAFWSEVWRDATCWTIGRGRGHWDNQNEGGLWVAGWIKSADGADFERTLRMANFSSIASSLEMRLESTLHEVPIHTQLGSPQPIQRTQHRLNHQ